MSSSVKIEKYIKAYQELQSDLETFKEKVKNLARQFLKEFYNEKESSFDINFVFYEPEGRIKSLESFKEKLVRKNYINTWKIIKTPSGQEDYKATILKNLDDIIGLRISCYFKKDEIYIYKDVIDYFESKGIEIKDYGNKTNKKECDIKNIQNSINKQSNGEPIYKIVCLYKEEKSSCPFELQIKSIIHNLWGEVEHEISYKAKQYNYNYDLKKELLSSNFGILKAADAQLSFLNKNTYKEMDMVNSLFFIYTKDEVTKKLDGKNPTFFYHVFFKLFNDDRTIQYIKEYVSIKLIGQSNFIKKSLDSNVDDKIGEKFLDLLGSTDLYNFDKMKEIKAISNILYNWSTSEETDFKIALYKILRSQIQDNEIINQNPDVKEDSDIDEDTPLYDDSENNEEKPDLRKIFEKDIEDGNKEETLICIKNACKINDYQKEILCRIFFNMYDII